MLAYSLKKVLELVPETKDMVKQASVEAEYPVDNEGSCLASALAIAYELNVANKHVDYAEMEKVAEAVTIYGIEDQVSQFSTQMISASNMVKQAEFENSDENFLAKQANFVGDLSGMSFIDVKEITDQATHLYKEAQSRNLVPADEVIRYSGNGYLSKEASIKSLSVRFHETGNKSFVKIARAIFELSDDVKPETILDICTTIDGMDKQAGLSTKGFNFFKESILTKQAEIKSALKVKLTDKEVPYEKIERIGQSRIASYIGKDIAKEMDGGPVHFKQVLETLPRDLQGLVHKLAANV